MCQKMARQGSKSYSPLLRFRGSSDLAFLADQALQPVTVDTHGNTKLTIDGAGTFDQDFDMEKFPFDTQSLRLVVRFYHDLDLCKLERMPMSLDKSTSVVFDENFSITEWACLRPYTEVDYRGKTMYGRKSAPKPQFSIIIPMKRAYGYYFRHIISIAFIVTTSTGAVFVFPRDDLGDRMDVILTLFLTIVATKFLVGEKLPQLAFMTYLDSYFAYCFLFFIIVIFEVSLAATSDFTDSLDRASAIIVGVSWLCFNAAAIIKAISVLKEEDGEHIKNAWIPAGQTQRYAMRPERVKNESRFLFLTF